jgi:hypothetical protein
MSSVRNWRSKSEWNSLNSHRLPPSDPPGTANGYRLFSHSPTSAPSPATRLAGTAARQPLRAARNAGTATRSPMLLRCAATANAHAAARSTRSVVDSRSVRFRRRASTHTRNPAPSIWTACTSTRLPFTHQPGLDASATRASHPEPPSSRAARWTNHSADTAASADAICSARRAPTPGTTWSTNHPSGRYAAWYQTVGQPSA